MSEQLPTSQSETEPEVTPSFEPSAVQLARADALHEYNWLSVYLPLIITAVLIIGAAGWMLWTAVINPDESGNNISQVSALADLVIIFTTIPLILSCLLLPAGAIALIAKDRDREHTRIHVLQRLLWRVDSFLEKVREKVEQTSPKVARPVIQANSWYSFMVQLLRRLKALIIG